MTWILAAEDVSSSHIHCPSRSSYVSKIGAGIAQSVQWLRNGRPRKRGSISIRSKRFSEMSRPGSGVHPASYSMRYRCFFSGGRAVGGVKLFTDPHIVSRLRMNGSMSPFPYLFGEWKKDKFEFENFRAVCLNSFFWYMGLRHWGTQGRSVMSQKDGFVKFIRKLYTEWRATPLTRAAAW